MGNVKKVLVAAGAALTLMAQAAQAGDATDEGFLMSLVGGAYSQFTSYLGVFCGATSPVTKTSWPFDWGCNGGVDQGVEVINSWVD